jgi:hypothetical protein
VKLLIAQTWDGAPLPPGEHATVHLAAAPEAEYLRLLVDAPFHGDPPPPPPPGPTPRLWEHEVVELFVAGPGADADVPYLEIELSPHGHHLVLRLAGLRRVVESGLPLDFRAAVDAEAAAPRWHGEALIPRAWLPPPPHRANAYRVHGGGVRRCHLAAAPVPGAAVDFHRPERFVAVTLPSRPV